MGMIPSIYKDEIKQLIEALMVNAVPSGFIGWFKRETAPEGWVVCDGTNGTPDLIGRYPVGALDSIGDTVAAGLPDIAGNFNANRASSGAFSHTNVGGVDVCNHCEYATNANVVFRASNGTVKSIAEDGTITYVPQEDSPYGKSDTVTPPSTKLLPCMKL